MRLRWWSAAWPVVSDYLHKWQLNQLGSQWPTSIGVPEGQRRRWVVRASSASGAAGLVMRSCMLIAEGLLRPRSEGSGETELTWTILGSSRAAQRSSLQGSRPPEYKR